MDNREYDALYDRLVKMEQETGIVLADSPTVNVGYEAVDFLPKETHETPMLSLDKTKDREALREFIGSHKTLLSWKMDGLTIVLTYENGALQKAVTRGNGVVGEVITNNAKVFRNIPLKIAFQGRMVLRGEAIITYSDFERINDSIEDVDAKYKNPRNLCSGSCLLYTSSQKLPVPDSPYAFPFYSNYFFKGFIRNNEVHQSVFFALLYWQDKDRISPRSEEKISQRFR